MIDLLIQNGNIIDSTNTPGYRGDLAITAGCIADIIHSGVVIWRRA